MKALKDLLFSSVTFDTNPMIDTVVNSLAIAFSGYLAYIIVGRVKDFIWFLSSSTMSIMNTILTIIIFVIVLTVYVLGKISILYLFNGGFILILPIVFIYAFKQQFE